MNRTDIAKLQSMQAYPSISLLTPTHRTAPENEQDPIRIKNLIREAEERLGQEFSKREYGPYIERLEKLAQQIDHRYNLDGLVMYVNQDYEDVYKLPFAVEPRVVIDETFYTRKLVLAMNRLYNYWVLVLSLEPTRLFEATRETLKEIDDGTFPMPYSGPGEIPRLRNEEGVPRASERDERVRKSFREVDRVFGEYAKNDNYPLVVCGVERYLTLFDQVTEHKNRIAARVAANYVDASPHYIGERVWPEAKAYFDQKRLSHLETLEAAMKERRVASGVEDIWQLAKQGRGQLLLVEENYHYPAVTEQDGWVIRPAEDPTAPGVIEDAVDDVVEEVLSKGGEIVFLEEGRLEEHNHIAMVLR